MSDEGMSGHAWHARFLDKILVGDDCWEWQASRNEWGYGHFHLGGTKMAHRVSYELFVGPIPDGLQVDHLCRNPACVRPSHLEAVTPRENTLRSDGITAHFARVTHCPQGHPYDDANTMRYAPGRDCRECQRQRLRNRRHGPRREEILRVDRERKRRERAALAAGAPEAKETHDG